MPKRTQEDPLTTKTKSGAILSQKEEMFCRYYIGQDGCPIGNGTQAAKEAGYEAKTYTVYSSIAKENLRKPHILERIRELLDDTGLNDEIVDTELSFVVKQNSELNPKVSAIREYNKLKGRHAAEELNQNITIKTVKYGD